MHGAEVFVHHTFGYQFGRSSPFSIWDWRQYHAKGIPDLHWVQHVLQLALLVGALALYRWPRRRSPLQIAAFTGALLVGFEMVLTHSFYLLPPWFFPFVAFAVLAPRTAEAAVAVEDDELGRTPRCGRSGLRQRCAVHRHPNGRAARRPAVGAALDQRALDPDVSLGDLEPLGEPGEEPADRPGGGAPDHGVVRARHAGIVTAAVPPASTRASLVCTCVCVPSTAVARPSRW